MIATTFPTAVCVLDCPAVIVWRHYSLSCLFCSDLVNGLVALMNSNVSSPVNLVSKPFSSSLLLDIGTADELSKMPGKWNSIPNQMKAVLEGKTLNTLQCWESSRLYISLIYFLAEYMARLEEERKQGTQGALEISWYSSSDTTVKHNRSNLIVSLDLFLCEVWSAFETIAVWCIPAT